MMQSVLADRLFADSMLDGIGLLARFLVVAPDSTAGTRLFREPPAECGTTLARYNERLLSMLSKAPPLATGTTDVLDPTPMRIGGLARQNWISFHDEVERDLADDGQLRPIRAFGAKMAEHAGRLAAVLAAYADPDCIEVDGDAMACAIALAQYYAAEMLRLHSAGNIDPDLRLAERLRVWWQAQSNPRCYLATIYQRGPAALRDATTARRIVGILEGHGWLTRLPAGTEVDGVARNEVWELVP